MKSSGKILGWVLEILFNWKTIKITKKIENIQFLRKALLLGGNKADKPDRQTNALRKGIKINSKFKEDRRKVSCL
jgi:hypothetical protein